MRLEWKTEREPKWAMMRQHTIRWAKRTEPLPCVFQARKPSGFSEMLIQYESNMNPKDLSEP
jgi:hypothetical protein